MSDNDKRPVDRSFRQARHPSPPRLTLHCPQRRTAEPTRDGSSVCHSAAAFAAEAAAEASKPRSHMVDVEVIVRR